MTAKDMAENESKQSNKVVIYNYEESFATKIHATPALLLMMSVLTYIR